MGCVTFPFIKHVKWVGLGLSHLVEYSYLDMRQTQHANPN